MRLARRLGGALDMTLARHWAIGLSPASRPPRLMPLSLPASQLITHVSAIGFATALSARALDPLIPSIAVDLGVDAASVALLSTAFALPSACVQPILRPL